MVGHLDESAVGPPLLVRVEPEHLQPGDRRPRPQVQVHRVTPSPASSRCTASMYGSSSAVDGSTTWPYSSVPAPLRTSSSTHRALSSDSCLSRARRAF